MARVGERLKVERETRNMTIDEMVAATGIGQSYLEALEKDAIDELPGRAFGKLYIRAYAEVFGFDPQPWIDDYDREQRSVQGASTEPMRSAPLGSRPVAEAIAQWKAARAAAEKAERAVAPAVEPIAEPIAEPVAEPAVEPVVAEPVPEPESVPEQVQQIDEPNAPPEVIPITAAEVVVPEPPTRVPTAKRLVVVPLLLLGFIVVASAIYFGMRGTGGNEAAAPTSVKPPPVEPAPRSLPLPTPPPVAVKPQPPPTPTPVVRTASPSGNLTVSEFGVGRRVVNLRLEGESDHFAEGERVCFASRVLGGRRGDRIRHVWLYEGKVEQSIPLRLGGADFRTHSNKTLGHAGQWTVEARGDDGGVLARTTFTCLPADR